MNRSNRSNVSRGPGNRAEASSALDVPTSDALHGDMHKEEESEPKISTKTNTSSNKKLTVEDLNQEERKGTRKKPSTNTKVGTRNEGVQPEQALATGGASNKVETVEEDQFNTVVANDEKPAPSKTKAVSLSVLQEEADAGFNVVREPEQNAATQKVSLSDWVQKQTEQKRPLPSKNKKHRHRRRDRKRSSQQRASQKVRSKEDPDEKGSPEHDAKKDRPESGVVAVPGDEGQDGSNMVSVQIHNIDNHVLALDENAPSPEEMTRLSSTDELMPPAPVATEVTSEEAEWEARFSALEDQVRSIPHPVATEVGAEEANWDARFSALQAHIDTIHGSETLLPTVAVETTDSPLQPPQDGAVFNAEHGMTGERDGGLKKTSFIKGTLRRMTKSQKICLLAFALVILLVVGITVPIAVSSNDSGSDPTASPPSVRMPSESPTGAPTQRNPWQRLGNDLDGKNRLDYAGTSVSISYDATVIAMGAPQTANSTSLPGYVLVFSWDAFSQSWIPMGQELVGSAADGEFGLAVSLSRDGNRLAVGGPQHDTGFVRVYEYNAGISSWVVLGSDIIAGPRLGKFGNSVSLSRDGDILAVGAFESNINGEFSGAVEVFQFDPSLSTWEQLGNTAVGVTNRDNFGGSVSVSASGLIFAAGAPRRDAEGTINAAGQVTVFRYDNASMTWMEIGHPIYGQAENDRFGFTVSLDDSGLVVAAGSRSGGRNSSGSVSIYSYDNASSNWTQLGRTISGETSGDEFGSSISLNRQDGTVVAVGSRFHDGDGPDTGDVRIFEYKDTTTGTDSTKDWIQVGFSIAGQVPGEESGRAVSLSGNGMVVAIGDRRHDGFVGLARVYALE